MTALQRLSQLLAPAIVVAAKPFSTDNTLDKVIAEIEKRGGESSAEVIPEDKKMLAVQNFWPNGMISGFPHLYLLSWSLNVAHHRDNLCIMDDQKRLRRILQAVDQWRGQPRAFRRCYQGLIHGYFTCNSSTSNISVARESLRKYLHERTECVVDRRANPEWVELIKDNIQIFASDPCAPYVKIVLYGNSEEVDHLGKKLKIDQTSWFWRDLILAQMRHATQLPDAEFCALLGRFLSLLNDRETLHDRGLTLLLDRYASVRGTPLHVDLRDRAAGWWGNPWLPSNATRWGAVSPDARNMVTDWLKLELIEAFFTKLAEDGLGDPRRMNFWKRYVKCIDQIEFALGSFARTSSDPDFVVLRKKMKGLMRALDASGSNNAFIMRMGSLVAVEFSGMGNALYLYDSSISIPFETTKILRLGVDEKNSLKSSSRILRLRHQDGIYGWDKWEEFFDATLKESFRIIPVANKHAGRKIKDLSYTGQLSEIEKLAQKYHLEIENRTARGGNILIKTDDANLSINDKLRHLGLKYKAGKGWWIKAECDAQDIQEN
ncbi:MAG: EH signature domain-containing protein [Comamonas sp.]